ncbi:AAA family ATPase [Cocleimonas sp. KMM 6892]|uniref:ATP-dependent nuclease n=1 Tax=unclassified Cocleimonas TaxID=2639732 RepID=UPI002DB682E5|nr:MULTISPECIES: AAA family ATPase [unclassified Cocleimonas]MEB8434036.1 AAA family ATPase [Cocleimonas sp. KMM 6892]MEC4716847.1 AAA family ATPase [Cocleimonas sp. KMM 6895]MEC4745998.1 AAA family ATPase [Cocleimonas sp. KMM 6896]
MSVIRQIYIKNFRSIKELIWYPNSGLNCLIGPGDSGKSTILDAIDLALGARRFYPFTDADFYKLDTTIPIEVFVTLGALDDQLMSIDTYGDFLRSYNSTTKQIFDEPQQGLESVLTIKLTVGEDLNPDWLLYSLRAEAEGLERRLPWKHRELVTPARLGTAAHQHLAWGNRSVLNKLSEDSLDVSSVLASISRRTRQTFADQPLPEVNEVLLKVKAVAEDLGVPVGDLQALLDVKGVSLSSGAISLHDSNNIPLWQLGTGSTRLLISGLQKAATSSKILIVDEAEYGLEPFRITRLLNELGSKEQHPTKQVFITTHSPYVLRELQAEQLHVMRQIFPAPPQPAPVAPAPVAPAPVAPAPVAPAPVAQAPVAQAPVAQVPQEEPIRSHHIYHIEGGNQQQATLRACAEAFFSRAVIVGEGKTEVGLIKGIDLFYRDIGNTGIHAKGASCTDGGGGDNYFKRAEIFKSLGYPTSILQDSDINTDAHLAKSQHCRDIGINVFEWGHGQSTEGALFNWCQLNVIPLLISFAIGLQDEQKINQHIINCSGNSFDLRACLDNPTDAMRPFLANAAGQYKWFKDISKAEELTRTVIGPSLANYNEHFSEIINSIIHWADLNGDFR